MNTTSQETKGAFNWKLGFLIWLFSVFAWFLVLPFTIAMLKESINELGSLKNFIISTFITNLILLGIASLVGLAAARKTGFSLPLFENWLGKNLTPEQVWGTIRKAFIIGVIVGVVIIIIDITLFTAYLQAATGVSGANLLNPGLNRPHPGYGLLAAISAGVTEETIFRLFGVSVISWIGGLIFKDPDGHPRAFVIWFAIVFMGVIFGLAHLQTPAMMGWGLSGAAIIRALVLNSVGGIIYGWMYWKNGFESAIMTHISTDLVLHVFIPMGLIYFQL